MQSDQIIKQRIPTLSTACTLNGTSSMETHSTFRPWVKILIGLFILLTGLIITSIAVLVSSHEFPSAGIGVFLALLIFIWTWMLFGEIRTKAVKVTIENNCIVVSHYLGLGKKKEYGLAVFDGFKTSILPSEYESYEFLYLMEKNKKRVKLSQFYHKNYKELKNSLAKSVKNLGNEKFNMLSELKEIFI